MDNITFTISMETIGKLAYLGLVAASIGAFYLFCVAMDIIEKKTKSSKK